MDACRERLAAHGADHVEAIALTPDAASWCVVARGFFGPATAFADAWSTRPADAPTISMFGREHAVPRRVARYGAAYACAGAPTTTRSLSDLPAPAAEALRRVRSAVDSGLNGALLNFYDASAGDYIAKHRDDEPGLDASRPIASLSWCDPPTHARRFRLAPHPKDAPAGAASTTLVVNHGDLVVMGGACQRTHTHQVLKPRRSVAWEGAGARVNATFRVLREGP